MGYVLVSFYARDDCGYGIDVRWDWMTVRHWGLATKTMYNVRWRCGGEVAEELNLPARIPANEIPVMSPNWLLAGWLLVFFSPNRYIARASDDHCTEKSADAGPSGSVLIFCSRG